MNEPAICLSVLGPSTAQGNGPGIVNWSEGGTKMVSHVPFYLLAEQKGKNYASTSLDKCRISILSCSLRDMKLVHLTEVLKLKCHSIKGRHCLNKFAVCLCKIFSWYAFLNIIIL